MPENSPSESDNLKAAQRREGEEREREKDINNRVGAAAEAARERQRRIGKNITGHAKGVEYAEEGEKERQRRLALTPAERLAEDVARAEVERQRLAKQEALRHTEETAKFRKKADLNLPGKVNQSPYPEKYPNDLHLSKAGLRTIHPSKG